MGTEVLRPQDCLIERIRVAPAPAFHRRKSSYGNGRKPVVTGQKKRVGNPPEPPSSVTKRSSSSDDLVIGQVTILRRGESVDSKINAVRSRSGTAPKIRFEDPKSVLPPVAGDTYAGSAFYLSPSPSSVPLPSFFSSKKQVSRIATAVAVDDSATRDLRRLLRLE